YLNLLNDFVKEEGENPPIGIILCTDKDHIEVEYALRGIDKPVGVSEFRITKALPKDLKDFLPDVKELENEILQELATR
ncbi:MAG TPA: PDDEXK nuclease domain-containing protein, partial [Alphaproteobacteria bacterium]|nr:PDDEXK nuclease domain-containing protein [Alphaproteobacteria bacterium]